MTSAIRVPVFGSGRGDDPDRGDTFVPVPPVTATDPLGVLLAILARPLVDLGLVSDPGTRSKLRARSHTPWGTLVQEMSSGEMKSLNIFGEGGTQ